MKKKIAISIIVFTLMLASAQVYAATYLDTNIISLITDGVNAIKSRYMILTNKETVSLNEQYNNKVGQYVSDKATQVDKDIEDHKNIEISRANQEIDNYYNSLVKETDPVFDSQVKQAKDSITTNVNNSVEDIKDDIKKEIEKQIKEQFK